MKKMKSNNRKRKVRYLDNESTLVIDDVRIFVVYQEQDRNLTDNDFATVFCRDRSIERLLMMARAMLIDFYRHHREEEVYDWSGCIYRPEMVDENRQESENILREVHECCRMAMERTFLKNWKLRTGYIGLVVSMMNHVCYALRDFDVFLNLDKELEYMVPRL